MIETPTITHTTAQPAAVISFDIPRSAMATVMGPAVVEIMTALGARTVYHGGYEGLGPAWGEFEGWIAANGHVPAPDLWEWYLAGPESSPDPSNWRTEFHRPLMG